MQIESPEAWCESNGFTREFEFSPIAADYVLGSEFVDVETVYHDDTDELRRVTFPSGAELVAHDKLWKRTTGPRLYCRQPPDAGPTDRDIAIAFWSGGDAVELVGDKERSVMKPFDAGEAHYEGPELGLIEDWRPWIEAGHHRFVYLYGGAHQRKSTFCKHAARELGRRILRIDGNHVHFKEVPGWTEVVRLASPDVVIVDDFRKFGSGARPFGSEHHPNEFAQQCTDADLVLFCKPAPDYEPNVSVPDGLVDEFHRFNGPEKSTYTKLVQEWADEYGIEVPDERLPELSEMARGFDERWVIEAFKRATVFGWEDLDFDPFEYTAEILRHQDSWWLGWKVFEDFDELGDTEFLWKETNVLRFDSLEDGFGAERVETDDVTYHGPHRSLRGTVREYMSAGMPRHILLRAPAGAGVTTLALDVATSVADRTIVMEPGAVRRIDYDQWERLLERRGPEFVIFAGVTPDHTSTLVCKIQELQMAGLPMTLYLASAVDEWTLAAEEAYGFDQVVNMRRPDREDRIQVVEKFADEFDTSIPEDRYDFLDTIYVERSPRRVRQAILRAGQVGWQRIDDIPGDSTL